MCRPTLQEYDKSDNYSIYMQYDSVYYRIVQFADRHIKWPSHPHTLDLNSEVHEH